MEPFRSHFPLFQTHPDLIYLDTAATSQKPRCVIDAMTQFYEKEYGTVHRAVYSLAARATENYDEVRSQVKRFIGADETGEVVFTKGSTDSINLVARSFGGLSIDEGDEILVLETEHHSNILPWQMLCQEKKAHLKVIPVSDDGDLIIEAFESLLSDKTKLVAIAHISNGTGVIHPIEMIIRMAHSVGAKVLVDAAQSAGHIKLNVKDWDVDFLAFSGHKVYGPTGIGVLYGKKQLLDAMAPIQGGGDMVDKVSFEASSYQPPPLKFEAGTPNIADVMGLGAALKFIEKVTQEKLREHEAKLTEYAYLKLKQFEGIVFVGQSQVEFLPNRSSLLSFHFPGIHCLDIGTLLDLRGVCVRTGHLCCQPALKRFGVRSLIRASFGVYNTEKDIDAFVARLSEVLSLLSCSV